MVFTQWSLEPNHLRGLTCWKVVSRRSSYCRDWHPNSTTYKPTNQNLHLQKCFNLSPQILMQAEGGDLLTSMGIDKIDFLPIV
ncbi:hypothetical protein BDL97_04G116500 [Sphagnum fallax]|nr:hypothetical protein BDL97_04G116500 [Sphagnum fallax]